MPRNFTDAFITELGAGRVRPVMFLQMQFNSGPAYAWSGIGTLNWNGQQWLGLGTMGTISTVEESSEITAINTNFSLSGIDQDLIMLGLNECRQGNPVKLWFGFLGDASNVIADPFQIYAGRMDVPTIDEGVVTATISISVENRLIDLNRSRERRYTHQDQQIDHPGDLGFQYVQYIQNWNGTWGKAGPGGIPVTGPKNGGQLTPPDPIGHPGGGSAPPGLSHPSQGK